MNKIKEIVYKNTINIGMAFLSKVFPEFFCAEPLKPTDRFIEYPFIMRNLPKLPARILDVGCAGSFLPLQLSSFGYNTTGLDIREYAIINKINFPGFSFIKGDIKESYFNDNFFDAVISVSTIEHIGIGGRYGNQESNDDDILAVKEMRRITKPGGVILLTFPFGKSRIVRPYMRVYDSARIERLLDSLVVEVEEFYKQDENEDWVKCSKDSVSYLKIASDKYSLCLLKIRKPEAGQ